MNLSDKIYVAGHRGLVGSAIVRELKSLGYNNIITRTHDELDLTYQADTEQFFREECPDYVFLAAAKVGGIGANSSKPADFIRENLQIQTNVLTAASQTKVKRLLFLGSSCIYPKFAEQPIKESSLMTGSLEPTNSAYAIAKIAGIEMCRAYNQQYGTKCLAVMPTNLYGRKDNYDLENSHVLPALIRKIHEAKYAGKKEVVIWGTGTPLREFLYSDDLANACVFLMNLLDPEFDTLLKETIVNIGSGDEVTIRDLVEVVKDVVGFEGELIFDTSRPDGTPRKRLDITKMEWLGWKPSMKLEQGITATYSDYVWGLGESLNCH